MTIDARIPLMVQPVRSELDRQQSLADLAARRQQTDLQRQQYESQQAQQEQAAQRQQVEMTAKLLRGVTPENYAERIRAGQAYGIDVSSAPPQFDPNWVSTYSTIAETLLLPDGEQKLTTTAQELRDAGYQPGTPEFIQAMRQRLEMRDSKVISAQAGGQAGLYGPNGYKPIIAPNDGSAPAGSPVGGGVQEGATATNPQTGQKLIFRGGQWQPMGGGAGNSVGGFQP